MAKVLARSTQVPPEHDRAELEESYRRISDLLEKDRVEIINGRIVVSPVPTVVHEQIVFRLMQLLMGITTERGWFFSTAIALFLGAQRDRYRPDLTVFAPNPPMWGKDHIYGDATTLIVEVVSESSVEDDHRNKPKAYAAAGVPLVLVIDCFAETVRLLSKPDAKTERYEQQLEVALGKALELPEPWGITLDTGKLSD